jgi:hypothetical protein
VLAFDFRGAGFADPRDGPLDEAGASMGVEVEVAGVAVEFDAAAEFDRLEADLPRAAVFQRFLFGRGGDQFPVDRRDAGDRDVELPFERALGDVGGVLDRSVSRPRREPFRPPEFGLQHDDAEQRVDRQVDLDVPLRRQFEEDDFGGFRRCRRRGAGGGERAEDRQGERRDRGAFQQCGSNVRAPSSWPSLSIFRPFS